MHSAKQLRITNSNIVNILLQELMCIAEGQLKENDVSSPYSSLPKLTALVR